MWRKGNPSALLVGVRIGVAIMKNNMEASQKMKNRAIIWSSNSTSVSLLEGDKNSHSKQHVLPYTHCSIADNSPYMEAT